MATLTLGTSATTTLTAVLYNQSSQSLLPADIATIQNSIKDDLNVAHPVLSGNFSYTGLLYIPSRGVLKVLPGDYVGIDPNGWPILVSANSIAGSGWTHS